VPVKWTERGRGKGGKVLRERKENISRQKNPLNPLPSRLQRTGGKGKEAPGKKKGREGKEAIVISFFFAERSADDRNK